jgi:hypothetical protein
VCSRRVAMPLHITRSVGRIRPYTGDDLLGRIRFQWTTGLNGCLKQESNISLFIKVFSISEDKYMHSKHVCNRIKIYNTTLQGKFEKRPVIYAANDPLQLIP